MKTLHLKELKADKELMRISPSKPMTSVMGRIGETLSQYNQ